MRINKAIALTTAASALIVAAATVGASPAAAAPESTNALQAPAITLNTAPVAQSSVLQLASYQAAPSSVVHVVPAAAIEAPKVTFADGMTPIGPVQPVGLLGGVFGALAGAAAGAGAGAFTGAFGSAALGCAVGLPVLLVGCPVLAAAGFVVGGIGGAVAGAAMGAGLGLASGLANPFLISAPVEGTAVQAPQAPATQTIAQDVSAQVLGAVDNAAAQVKTALPGAAPVIDQFMAALPRI